MPRAGRAVTRTEFFARLGMLRVVDPMTEKAFQQTEDGIWRGNTDAKPHGDPWHVSFHASQFPGDDPRACGRYSVYELMETARKEPTSRWLRGLGHVGKSVELLLVQRWGEFGVLVSADTLGDDEFQTGFIDDDHWLTGNCDAIIVPEGWDRPHVVEIKGKSAEVIKQMQSLQRGPDDAHVRQIKTYIGLAHESADRWTDLKPCVDGTIFYFSRDDPNETWEFFYSYDPNFMAAGREQLAEWRDYFQRGELPPHPFGGKEWSKKPCQYCPFKKFVCRPDTAAKITSLQDSQAIEWTRNVRGEYNYDTTRQRVLDRWGAEDFAEGS